jgi:hypothetical protein
MKEIRYKSAKLITTALCFWRIKLMKNYYMIITNYLNDLPEPMTLGDGGVTAYRVILISDPNDQNYVEGSSRVIEKFRHDSFHS